MHREASPDPAPSPHQLDTTGRASQGCLWTKDARQREQLPERLHPGQRRISWSFTACQDCPGFATSHPRIYRASEDSGPSEPWPAGADADYFPFADLKHTTVYVFPRKTICVGHVRSHVQAPSPSVSRGNEVGLYLTPSRSATAGTGTISSQLRLPCIPRAGCYNADDEGLWSVSDWVAVPGGSLPTAV